MRSIVIIALLLLYLLPAGGVSIHAHYCGGELESLSLFGIPNGGCACDAEADEEADCCGDRVSVFHFRDSQQANPGLRLTEGPVSLPLQPLALPDETLLPTSKRIPPIERGNLHCHAPPLFVQHAQWLI